MNEGSAEMSNRQESVDEQVYVELVRTLFANMAPSVIMTCAFTLAVVLIHAEVEHRALLALGMLGIAATITRLAITGGLRHRALTAPLNGAQARALELAFGIPYLAFGACLGLFGALVFWLDAPEAHMLMICLLVGYCAGVATGTGLRPYIAIPSMILAIVPAACVAALRLEPLYLGMSGTALALLAGGTHSLLMRTSSVTAEVTKRLNAGTLARRDGLTALPNRLALREYYDENRRTGPGSGLTAVHYLDLDGFKPVNDHYGHATGDELLGGVARRLTNCVRNQDIVARLGGDEFAILQFGIPSPAEAEKLAQRVDAALRQPFELSEHVVSISACIGTVTASPLQGDLEDLLRRADQELYRAKRDLARISAAA